MHNGEFFRHEKDKKLKHIVIKDVSFRPKQGMQNAINDILNLFALKKNEPIKERITRDISNHFQQEKEDY